MRYFKYKHTNKVYNAAWKAEFTRLTKDEQKIVRKNKVLQKIGVTVSFVVMIAFFVGGVFAMQMIPKPESIVLQFLHAILIFFLVIVDFCLSGLVGFAAASPIFKRVTDHPLVLRQKALHQACAHLRRYYGMQEPFIVTKCFDCSNENFKNHDVCIFVHGDELRITADLQRGFAHGEKDLGCYAFRADEITLTKQDREGHLTLELRTDKVTFLLGYRAKGYIKKHYLSQ